MPSIKSPEQKDKNAAHCKENVVKRKKGIIAENPRRKLPCGKM
jgi:hypothetical protein